MTGSRVLLLSLLVVAAAPLACADAEFEASREAQVDGLYLATAVGADIAATGGQDEEQARLQTEFLASFIPRESQLNGILSMFFVTLYATEADEAASGLGEADVESQTDALMQDGVTTQGDLTASEQEVAVAARASAGSVSHDASASAEPQGAIEEASDDVKIESLEVPASMEGTDASAAAPAGQPEPIAPAVDAAPASLMGAGAEIPPMSVPAALAATAAVLGASTTTAVFAVPGWRTALVRAIKRFGWLLLFSRIAQEDILNHERRSELLEFVRNNPGERVEIARRTLGFSNGSMHYHLRVLQDRGLVKVLKDGSLARLYPRGPKITPIPYVPAQRKRFLEALSTAPGKTQRELATTLGLSERMVSYHVHALAEQGLVEVRAEGARKRLFPAAAVAMAAPALVPAA